MRRPVLEPAGSIAFSAPWRLYPDVNVLLGLMCLRWFTIILELLPATAKVAKEISCCVWPEIPIGGASIESRKGMRVERSRDLVL